MSDFVHFMCWSACVFASALCVTVLAVDHWDSQSAAMSLLLPLCLSVTLGSFLFLGFCKFRKAWRRYTSPMQSDSMARVSQTNRAVTEATDFRLSRFVLD
jgi:hypothetical protein